MNRRLDIRDVPAHVVDWLDGLRDELGGASYKTTLIVLSMQVPSLKPGAAPGTVPGLRPGVGPGTESGPAWDPAQHPAPDPAWDPAQDPQAVVASREQARACDRDLSPRARAAYTFTPRSNVMELRSERLRGDKPDSDLAAPSSPPIAGAPEPDRAHAREVVRSYDDDDYEVTPWSEIEQVFLAFERAALQHDPVVKSPGVQRPPAVVGRISERLREYGLPALLASCEALEGAETDRLSFLGIRNISRWLEPSKAGPDLGPWCWRLGQGDVELGPSTRAPPSTPDPRPPPPDADEQARLAAAQAAFRESAQTTREKRRAEEIDAWMADPPGTSPSPPPPSPPGDPETCDSPKTPDADSG